MTSELLACTDGPKASTPLQQWRTGVQRVIGLHRRHRPRSPARTGSDAQQRPDSLSGAPPPPRAARPGSMASLASSRQLQVASSAAESAPLGMRGGEADRFCLETGCHWLPWTRGAEQQSVHGGSGWCSGQTLCLEGPTILCWASLASLESSRRVKI